MNLIVWCNWLIVFMYVVNSDADLVQMTDMSSMNLFHSIMCALPNSFKFLLIFP